MSAGSDKVVCRSCWSSRFACQGQHKERLRDELPKIYSQDLVNNLFRHPYTKIEFVMDELQVHRNTASRYLEELVGIGLLTKHRLGKENFYLNDALFQLLLDVGSRPYMHAEMPSR